MVEGYHAFVHLLGYLQLDGFRQFTNHTRLSALLNLIVYNLPYYNQLVRKKWKSSYKNSRVFDGEYPVKC